MTGTYPDSNEESTFWDYVSPLKSGRGRYPEEEMALITADRSTTAPGSKHRTPPSPNNSTALVKWESPRTTTRRSSYNFNEVATNLQSTAEQALEASVTTSKQNSISRGVARIVLEEGNKAVDSSSSKEYIAGVVRKVARYAQGLGHDGETSGSPANHVIQPEVSPWHPGIPWLQCSILVFVLKQMCCVECVAKGMGGLLMTGFLLEQGTTSLGTMMSFFVIWCVSLCASHMDSKDLPAPALKLAAEEVASVLQSSRSSRSGTAL
jgi:hypothetical protein